MSLNETEAAYLLASRDDMRQAVANTRGLLPPIISGYITDVEILMIGVSFSSYRISEHLKRAGCTHAYLNETEDREDDV